MTAISREAWPTATLDGVRRLRVLAAVLPGVHLEEREVELPFERVWRVLTDLERNVPRFDRNVASLRVTQRNASRLRVVVRTSGGLSLPFQVEIEDGFMWMQAPARSYVVGIGAGAINDHHTRYAHLEGIPHRLGELASARTRRHVNEDIEGIARLLASHG
jgi:hypothetical protein